MATFRDALNLEQQASPDNPPSGYTKLFFKSGDVLFMRTSSGVERLVTPGVMYAFSNTGTLTVAQGTHRIYNDTGNTLTIKSVRATVGTVSTSGSVIVDVKINGTTIFTTQAKRPTIAVSTNTIKVTNPDVTTIADGSYFTVDVAQTGTSAADLTVQIQCG